MKQLQSSLLILITLMTPIACKTVQRDDFANSTSEVRIILPEQFNSMEPRATFTRTDEKDDSHLVKGRELVIKLPSGTYAVDLVLLNAEGTEEYRSCNIARPYAFREPKEIAIVDICKGSNRSIVIQTLPSIIVPVVPPVAPVVPINPVIPLPVEPIVPPTEPLVVTPEPSLFLSETSCFGQPVLVTQQGNEIVFKIDGTIENKLIDVQSYLRCNITINLPKSKGRIYSPMAYQMTYTADDKTLKQNLWLMVSGRDEKSNLSLPCAAFLFNSAANSKKSFICSFYDTSPEHLLEVFPKTKADHDASCLSETKTISFSFTIAGPNKSLLYSLKIPELRMKIPQTEACL
ncbi:MAG: hypothetical protein H7318_08275 [Oligoflexus sp.]|nr:hypothetical protein [Oligoflexus sp.]